MRSIALVSACAGLLLAAGHDDDQAAQVRSVFARLDDAQRTGDADMACKDVFLVAEAGRPDPGKEGRGESGESPTACRAAFERATSARAAQVDGLRTTVQSVRIKGDAATATVRSEVTRTDGSRFGNTYTRDLVRRDGAWRIRISPEG